MGEPMTAPTARALAGTFSFLPTEDVIYGAGQVRQLGGLLERYGVQRALLMTGHSLNANDELMGRVKEACGGRVAGIFHETRPHVPRQVVLEATALARALNIDGIISFGGGSPNDTGKGVAIALASDLRTREDFDRMAVKFSYPDKVEIPALPGDAPPMFSIPTTLSGGEFTHVTGLTDEVRKVKDLYIDRKLAAKAVILDPELTLATPEWLWLSTGIRSVDHAVELLCSTTAHPYTDALSISALRMLAHYLRICAADSTDVTARLHCQIASWMSVSGAPNVTLGLSHGLGHQLGGRCGVPHGVTSCVMLSHVMRFNRNHLGERPIWIARELGLPVAGLSAPAAADALADFIDDLVKALGQPTHLREVGVSPADFEAIARDALEDLVVATNPRPVKAVQEVVQLLGEAY